MLVLVEWELSVEWCVGWLVLGGGVRWWSDVWECGGGCLCYLLHFCKLFQSQHSFPFFFLFLFYILDSLSGT